MEHYDLIVVGAGPAGLLAAIRAAELQAKVLILEKMPSEGRKLLITGKGRCNVTNGTPIGDFIKHVFPNGKFLRNALSKFGSSNILQLLEEEGVDCVLGPNNRYFPKTDRAMDVLNALLNRASKLGIEIRKNEKVEKLIIEDEKITGIKSNGKILHAQSVVVATGGKSYPRTGSTGDGYELARQAGHSIVKPIPALVPLATKGRIAKQLQGLNLTDVKATLWVEGKKDAEFSGEMIFTHFGISGPVILTLSRFAVNPLAETKKVEITLDFFHTLNEIQFDEKMRFDIDLHGKKKIINLLSIWLPASLVNVIIDILQIDPNKETHQLTAIERRKMLLLMKNFPLEISHNHSFNDAIITAGGVSLDEISAKTMQSKIVSGLYFAGEIIDLDAETGGYNLQIAYSTGWLAGDSVGRNLGNTN